jgi:hypothetical protein
MASPVFKNKNFNVRTLLIMYHPNFEGFIIINIPFDEISPVLQGMPLKTI